MWFFHHCPNPRINYLSLANRYPIWPAASLTAGLFFSLLALFYAPWLPPLGVVWIAFIALIIALFFGRFLFCGVLLGLIAVGLNSEKPYTQPFYHCQFQVQLLRPSYSTRRTGQEIRLFAEAISCDNIDLPAQTVQYWDNQKRLAAHIGKRLHVSADLYPVTSRLNLYGFDYEKYLFSQGIRLQAKKLRITASHPETRWLLRARNTVAETLQAQLSKPNAAIILALLSGNRSALSPEQKTTMQATGTSHLLAISGLHLALVGGVVWLLCQWIWALSWRLSSWLSPRQAGAIVALLAITVYALFTGFEVPVKRAWVMFSLLIMAWLLLRGVSNSSLLLAACAVMVVSPAAVISVGFYFSFIATFVVLWAVRLPVSPLTQVLLMQLVINLTLLPITWATFGVISLSAFFVNLLVIPWLGLWVLPWAIAATLVNAIAPDIAAPIWWLLEHSTTMMWQTIAFAERLPITFYPLTRPPLWAVVVAVIAVTSVLISGKKWLLTGLLVLLLPPLTTPAPAVIVADSRYTSVLIHNGKSAILINPGRRYRQHNAAQKWQRYLQQYRLQLAAIVLQNDTLTRGSSTRWLLDAFPAAKVITLQDFPLPYPASYCQGLQLKNLALHTSLSTDGQRCQATLSWYDTDFSLFTESGDNAITTKSQLTWQGKSYNAQDLGAIILQHQNGNWSLHTLRQSTRLWRMKKR